MTKLHLWLHHDSGFEQERRKTEVFLDKWDNPFYGHICNIVVGTAGLRRADRDSCEERGALNQVTVIWDNMGGF